MGSDPVFWYVAKLATYQKNGVRPRYTGGGKPFMPERWAGSRAPAALIALLSVCLAGATYLSAHAQTAPPAPVAPNAPDAARAPLAPNPVLDKYCVTCHNARLKTA